jgi:enamine deaminase RidA (YjgF/YER057c/UK114 family)
MEKTRIDPPGTKKYAPYSPGVVVGNTIWLSGQIDVDSGDTIEVQTQGALNKIDALLSEAGASKHDVVFAQVLLKSMDFYAPMNEVYGKWVDSMEVKPARAAFAVDALLPMRLSRSWFKPSAHEVVECRAHPTSMSHLKA